MMILSSALRLVFRTVVIFSAQDLTDIRFEFDSASISRMQLSPLAGFSDISAITGRIDLVHCNNSRDEFGSGRDRHAGLESGQIDPALILDVVRAAGAPLICETPDPAADIRWLRARLS